MSELSVKSWNAPLLNQFTRGDRVTPLPVSQYDNIPNFNARMSNTFNDMLNDDARQWNTIYNLTNLENRPPQPRWAQNGELKLNQQTNAVNSLFNTTPRMKNINLNQAQIMSDDVLKPEPLITRASQAATETLPQPKTVESFTVKRTSTEALVVVGVMVAVIIFLLFFVVNIYIQTKKMEFMICFLRHQNMETNKRILDTSPIVDRNSI